VTLQVSPLCSAMLFVWPSFHVTTENFQIQSSDGATPSSTTSSMHISCKSMAHHNKEKFKKWNMRPKDFRYAVGTLSAKGVCGFASLLAKLNKQVWLCICKCLLYLCWDNFWLLHGFKILVGRNDGEVGLLDDARGQSSMEIYTNYNKMQEWVWGMRQDCPREQRANRERYLKQPGTVSVLPPPPLMTLLGLSPPIPMLSHDSCLMIS
jgi:hypothetical protein